MLYAVFESLEVLTDVHCAILLVFSFNATFLSINLFAIRTWRIWFLFFASKEKLVRERALKAGKEVTNDMFWFTDRRHLVKKKFLWKVVLAVTLIEVVIADGIFVAASTQPGFSPYDPECGSLELLGLVTVFAAGESSFSFSV